MAMCFSLLILEKVKSFLNYKHHCLELWQSSIIHGIGKHCYNKSDAIFNFILLIVTPSKPCGKNNYVTENI